MESATRLLPCPDWCTGPGPARNICTGLAETLLLGPDYRTKTSLQLARNIDGWLYVDVVFIRSGANPPRRFEHASGVALDDSDCRRIGHALRTRTRDCGQHPAREVLPVRFGNHLNMDVEVILEDLPAPDGQVLVRWHSGDHASSIPELQFRPLELTLDDCRVFGLSLTRLGDTLRANRHAGYGR